MLVKSIVLMSARTFAGLCLVLLLLRLPGRADESLLLRNGGFTQGPDPAAQGVDHGWGSRGVLLPAGDARLTDWSIVSPVWLVGFTTSPARCLDLGPQGSVAAVVQADPGVTYDVRFLMYASKDKPLVKSLEVQAPGVRQTVSVDGGVLAPVRTWHEESARFIADSESPAITFRSLVGKGDGPLLADVEVIPYDPARTDEVDIRRAYVRYVRGVREQDAKAVFLLQSTDYVYIDKGGNTIDRVNYGSALKDMLHDNIDDALEIESIAVTRDQAVVRLHETLTWTEAGKPLRSEGRAEDTWRRTAQGWRLVQTHEMP